MSIKELLLIAVQNNGSDLHLLPHMLPAVRVDGNLIYLNQYPSLTKEDVEVMVFSLLSSDQKDMFITNKELDFSFGMNIDGKEGRFRANVYYQKGAISGAFRYLPPVIKTLDELGLPKIAHKFSDLKQGFILVTGPTGHGKSTTLAAIMNEINQKRSSHILTIEDPIEYIYPEGKSMISQREYQIDFHSWPMALRSALREDPDVVLIGEMRDAETISAAITIAETGHLVFSTLHTNSAAQTIDRIIDSFNPTQQTQIRVQLAATLKGIISQRLIPKINGGRIPGVEILIGTPAVATNIREGKTHLIDSVIQTSQDAGMITLESSLAALVMSGHISLDVAKSYALRPEELLRIIG